MKRILAIAWLNLIELFRDRSGLVAVIVLPLMLTWVFGAAFVLAAGAALLLPDATGLRIDFRSGAEYDMPGESMILLTEQND